MVVKVSNKLTNTAKKNVFTFIVSFIAEVLFF